VGKKGQGPHKTIFKKIGRSRIERGQHRRVQNRKWFPSRLNRNGRLSHAYRIGTGREIAGTQSWGGNDTFVWTGKTQNNKEREISAQKPLKEAEAEKEGRNREIEAGKERVTTVLALNRRFEAEKSDLKGMGRRLAASAGQN